MGEQRIRVGRTTVGDRAHLTPGAARWLGSGGGHGIVGRILWVRASQTRAGTGGLVLIEEAGVADRRDIDISQVLYATSDIPFTILSGAICPASAC